MADRRAMASGFSLSEMGTGEGRCAASGGTSCPSRWEVGAKVARDMTGVIGEKGGARGEPGPSPSTRS